MDAFLQLLLTPGVVETIAVLILITAAWGYWGWFARSVNDVLNGLRRLTSSLQEAGDHDWNMVRERAGRQVAGRDALMDLWHETEGRVSPLRIGDKTMPVMFGSPRDLWNARSVLGRQFNLDLADVIPNILVGVGLLFTFVFLTAALTSTTAALTGSMHGSEGIDVVTAEAPSLQAASPATPLAEPAIVDTATTTAIPDVAAGQANPVQSTDAKALRSEASPARSPTAVEMLVAPLPAAISVPSELSQSERNAIAATAASQKTEDAIRDLLKVAGSKFLTSLTGLLASLLWMFSAKKAVNKVEVACDVFLLELTKVVPINGGERLVEQQLAIGQSSLQQAKDSFDLTEELLVEARDQTGALKRFETDLAVSLASAINPQMQAMTDRLVGAIDNLSLKLSSMNQDALEKMLADFSGMIRDATQTEMAEMREALATLATQLQTAGQSIGSNAVEAAAAINEAGVQILARSNDVAASLSLGATNLERATDSLKLTMNDLDFTFSEAVEAGKQSVAFVRETLAQAGQTVERLGTVSTGLAEASTAIETVSGKLSGIMEDVEELSREQRAVVRAVQEVAPQATAAVERVSAVLDQAAQQTLSMMQQTRQSMDATATALGKTVASITEGVGVYTKGLAELHRTMDSHLARAVGSLDKGVSGLNESIEELSDVMESSGKRTR